MTTTTTDLALSYLDVTRLAVASFLAPYREPTLTAYTQDLKGSSGGASSTTWRCWESPAASSRCTCDTWKTADTPLPPSPAGPRHAVRDAPRRPAHGAALRHGQANLNRHAAYAVAAYLAVMSPGCTTTQSRSTNRAGATDVATYSRWTVSRLPSRCAGDGAGSGVAWLLR